MFRNSSGIFLWRIRLNEFDCDKAENIGNIAMVIALVGAYLLLLRA